MGEMSKAQTVGEISKPPLLPVRHPEADFFVCDIFDAAPKGDMASMEHPIFSLSTKPDRRARRYESGHNYIEIKPSYDGLATVHDRDILIYCISQIIAANNQNIQVSQNVRFKAYDLLKATNRMTNGQGYDGLKASLERLRGTQITTNIITGGKEIWRNFGLIESSEIVSKTRDGRMQEVEIKLSDWVFNAIRANEILTLHRDYFRLRKPIERRIYELARKHCGRQAEWRISLENLQAKCGSNSTLREFRRLVGAICEQDAEHGHMPDYAVQLVDDVLVVRNRGSLPALADRQGRAAGSAALMLWQPEDDEWQAAREAAPGWDVQVLLREWKEWAAKRDRLTRDLGKAFIGFCRKKGACR